MSYMRSQVLELISNVELIYYLQSGWTQNLSNMRSGSPMRLKTNARHLMKRTHCYDIMGHCYKPNTKEMSPEKEEKDLVRDTK